MSENILKFSYPQYRNILRDFKAFKNYEKGELILQKGEVSDHIFFILNGSVKVSTFTRLGREVWHSILQSGSFFGEISALTRHPRSATITVMEQSKIIILSQTQFKILLKKYPDISWDLLQQLAQRLRATTERYEEHIGLNASQRIKNELLKLAKKEKCALPNYVIQPKPKIKDVAQELNISREIVSREISNLVSKGVLTKTPTSIIINDINFLANTSLL